MDRRTSPLTQGLTGVGRQDVTITEKLVGLECRMREAADDLSTMYLRRLRDTTDGMERLIDQTTTALSPVHQTQRHPWTMLGVAVCAGYVMGRLQALARPFPSAVPPAAHWRRRRP
jgi:hypothetical protein